MHNKQNVLGVVIVEFEAVTIDRLVCQEWSIGAGSCGSSALLLPCCLLLGLKRVMSSTRRAFLLLG